MLMDSTGLSSTRTRVGHLGWAVEAEAHLASTRLQSHVTSHIAAAAISAHIIRRLRWPRPRRNPSSSPRKRSRPIRAMRAVVQRVAAASVEVEGKIVSEIEPGLLVLVGIHESDTDTDADCICRKVLNMRLFTNDSTGRHWDQNVMQKNYGVLLVSQFTLYGIMKGNKPDFHVAMSPQKAKPFYESVVDRFRKSYKPDLVKDGIFGAMMKVNLINDGPVTMQLDSSPSSENTADSEEP